MSDESKCACGMPHLGGKEHADECPAATEAYLDSIGVPSVREREYHDMNGLKGRCKACEGMGVKVGDCRHCHGSGIDPEAAEPVARLFHESYERLAPRFGYRTREASAVVWEDVPEDNRRLMVATAGFVVARLKGRDGGADLDFSEEEQRA